MNLQREQDCRCRCHKVTYPSCGWCESCAENHPLERIIEHDVMCPALNHPQNICNCGREKTLNSLRKLLTTATTDGRRECSFDHDKLIARAKREGELEGVEKTIAIIAEADDLPGVDTPEKKWAYTRTLDRVLAVARAEYKKEQQS